MRIVRIAKEEHFGEWYTGANLLTNDYDRKWLYVTDEIDEAIYYAKMKGGRVYVLKPEFNRFVRWALGHSEGLLSQNDIKKRGGFLALFDEV